MQIVVLWVVEPQDTRKVVVSFGFRTQSLVTQKQEKWRQTFWEPLPHLERLIRLNFKNLIRTGNVYACEKHFKPEEVFIRKFVILII